MAKETAEQYLKKITESLDKKELDTYDLIIAMRPENKDSVLNKCPECEDKIVVWNIEDPYFLPHGHSERIFTQIKAKVTELPNLL